MGRRDAAPGAWVGHETGNIVETAGRSPLNFNISQNTQLRAPPPERPAPRATAEPSKLLDRPAARPSQAHETSWTASRAEAPASLALPQGSPRVGQPLASRASAAEPTGRLEKNKNNTRRWSPPRPPRRRPRPGRRRRRPGQQQRGYFSEMLQYGLSREDVTSSTLLETEEPKTRPPVPASTYTRVVPHLSQIYSESQEQGIEPKVIMAAEPKPGGMPQALEIHRRTKLYASQDITALLKERGIDYSVKFSSEVFGKVGAPSTKLPLEAFDDASYEVENHKIGWPTAKRYLAKRWSWMTTRSAPGHQRP